MNLRDKCYRGQIVMALTAIADGIQDDLNRGYYMTQAPYTETDIAEMNKGIADIAALIASIQTQT